MKTAPIALAALLASSTIVSCETLPKSIWTITDRPAAPRGGEGTFQQRWVNRVLPHPGEGVASFYDDKLTATGERLNVNDPGTCSRPDPSELGARLRVTRGDKSITCRVNDIGPAKRLNRAIDLTPAGARALGITKDAGLGIVRIERTH